MTTINMTPFIDIMLVLLIIFMVSAPLLTSSIEVNPPPAEGSPITSQTKPVIVSVANGGVQSSCFAGSLYVNDQPVTRDALIATTKADMKTPDEKVYLKGSVDLCYKDAAELLGALRHAGVGVQLVVGPPTSAEKQAK